MSQGPFQTRERQVLANPPLSPDIFISRPKGLCIQRLATEHHAQQCALELW